MTAEVTVPKIKTTALTVRFLMSTALVSSAGCGEAPALPTLPTLPLPCFGLIEDWVGCGDVEEPGGSARDMVMPDSLVRVDERESEESAREDDACISTATTDEGANGTADDVTRTFYDRVGNMFRYEEDYGADDVIDYVVTVEPHTGTTNTDQDGDGDVDSVSEPPPPYNSYQTTTVTMNEDGSSTQEDQYDWDGDGVVDAISTTEYTSEGMATSRVDQYGAYRTSSELDDQGRVILQLSDYDGDGVNDLRAVFGYDDEGRYSIAEYDDGADGTWSFREMYAYDDQGRMGTIDTDGNGDGQIDQTAQLTYFENGDTEVSTTRLETSNGVERTIERRTASWHLVYSALYQEDVLVSETSFVFEEDCGRVYGVIGGY